MGLEVDEGELVGVLLGGIVGLDVGEGVPVGA